MRPAIDPPIIVRIFRLLRVDPRYTINICFGTMRNESGDRIPHQHAYYGASIGRNRSAPVLPIEHRHIENGRTLSELCPFSSHIVQFPPPGIESDVNPVDSSVSQLVTDENIFESISNVERNATIYNTDSADRQSFSMERPCENLFTNSEPSTPVTLRAVFQMPEEDWQEFLSNQPSTSRLH